MNKAFDMADYLLDALERAIQFSAKYQ